MLGVVVLSITGAEALYADMGHFGRKPIRQSWYLVVFPALLASYYGFMQSPEVPRALAECARLGLIMQPGSTSYFLGRETLLPTGCVRLPQRAPATAYLGLPPNRVVELGMQVICNRLSETPNKARRSAASINSHVGRKAGLIRCSFLSKTPFFAYHGELLPTGGS